MVLHLHWPGQWGWYFVSAITQPPSPYIGPFQLGESVFGTTIKKTAVPVPTVTTATTLFTVTGGAILVSSLIGIVSTAIGATASNLSLGTAPTIGSAAAAGIGGPTAIANLVAGSHISAPFAVGSPGITLVAPAVPLTGVAVTNNYHGTVAVTLAAGTLTGVMVNGVAVGSTPWSPATYQVPAHGTISWAGSVAPTWTWASTSVLVTDTFGSENTPREFVVSPGAITLTTSVVTTGAITWYLSYMQLDSVPGVEGTVSVVS